MFKIWTAMDNARSIQDHYNGIAVHPDATKKRFTKPLRHAALKRNSVKRTSGEIDKAFRVLTDAIRKTAYDIPRGSHRGNPKHLFFYTGIVVTGYVSYRVWRSVNSAIDNIKAWPSNVASAVRTQLASSASSVKRHGQATMEKIGSIASYASKLKDSDAVSAVGSKIASSASYVASASKDGLSKVTKRFQK